MSDDHLRRAVHLVGAGRAEDALAELELALAEDPTNAYALGLRAYALADMDDLPAAMESAQRAIGEAPDWSFPHHVHGTLLLRTEDWRDARAAAEEAVALDPEEPDHRALLASAHAGMARWRDARAAADAGLELDPDDERLLNLRALSSRMLGELEDAEGSLETALASDPDNAWTLENLGFAKLQANQPVAAAQLFRESLRLDPESRSAREGLALAIKARLPLFRPILAWQLLCARLSSGRGGLLILGFWVLNQVLQRSPLGGTPVGNGLLAAYLVFVWMSWAGNALFDVALLARRDLRGILDARERTAAGVVAGLVLGSLATLGALAAGLTSAPSVVWLMAAGALAGAAIPVSGWPPLANAKARRIGGLVAASATLSALAGVVCAWLGDRAYGAAPPEPGTAATPTDGGAAVGISGADLDASMLDTATALFALSILVSVASSWLLSGLAFVPESRRQRGTRRRP